MLLGARQVDKIWIMRHFGKQEYEKVAYNNCDDEPRGGGLLFELDYDIDRILLTLQAITGTKITPKNTLIILDEIQETPRGIHSLKYFCEKAPELHVMVASSLLGGAKHPLYKVTNCNLPSRKSHINPQVESSYSFSVLIKGVKLQIISRERYIWLLLPTPYWYKYTLHTCLR